MSILGLNGFWDDKTVTARKGTDVTLHFHFESRSYFCDRSVYVYLWVSNFKRVMDISEISGSVVSTRKKEKYNVLVSRFTFRGGYISLTIRNTTEKDDGLYIIVCNFWRPYFLSVIGLSSKCSYLTINKNIYYIFLILLILKIIRVSVKKK